ncbi:hypothetical protein [Duganella violaceipulchra]|uniref:Uncharacterized protein n=1 Tax=Duganella violaceipulchra TaxID=2849652 RepID=A0AA41HA13_9BURK|nr:hypothetical protein [Duganella violaceicalia]MBV6320987.1 hypothetical protein [Duganella violaceicalia]MCP2009767.1 hypothetical protein [Duganella violaceicalia]
METAVVADTGRPQLEQLLAAYSEGRISRRELEQSSGLWFGEILNELARRGLPLPRVDSRLHFNEAQRNVFERVFG